jgi:hypothetical protein
MGPDEKRKLAERVVELTVMNRLQDQMPEEAKERLWEEQVGLHLKHFEPEQLTAHIDFYETEMGKSISLSQKRMADDFRSGIKLVSHYPENKQ